MQRAYSNKSRSTSLTDRSNDILSHDRIAFQALKGAPVAAGVSAGPLPPGWTMMLMGLVVFGFIVYRRQKKGAAAIAAA